MYGKNISSYILRKFYLNFFGIFIVLLTVVFGNQFVIVAKESIKIGLFNGEIFPYIFLKLIRDFPVIFNFSFFSSILVSFKQFNSTSEKVIFHSGGLSNLDLFSLVRKLVFFAAIISAISSMYISPIANKELVLFKEKSQLRPDYLFIKEGQFQEFSEHVLFAEKITNEEDSLQTLENLIVFDLKGNNKSVITAKSGEKYINMQNNVALDLRHGKVYEINEITALKSILNFDKYKITLYQEEASLSGIKPKNIETKSLVELIESGDFLSISELGYRISQPILLVFMVIIAFLISDVNARNNKNNNLILGVLIYFISYTGIISIKDFLDKGTFDPMIGYIIPHLFFISIIFFLLKKQNFFYKYSHV